jgi:Glycogen recognition site of AMP-activated protein kinase
MSDELTALDPAVQHLIAEAKRPVSIDASARERLMDAISAEPLPHRESPMAWLFAPRTFALPPLATLAAAASLVGIGVIAGYLINRDGRAPAEREHRVVVTTQLPDSVQHRVIKFVLVAPQASKVAVVGDFNGWDTAASPAERNPDGSWTTFVPLLPGRHVYSFVVDGRHFVADPTAPIAPDDGYGQNNSVVVVSGASS